MMIGARGSGFEADFERERGAEEAFEDFEREREEPAVGEPSEGERFGSDVVGGNKMRFCTLVAAETKGTMCSRRMGTRP